MFYNCLQQFDFTVMCEIFRSPYFRLKHHFMIVQSNIFHYLLRASLVDQYAISSCIFFFRLQTKLSEVSNFKKTIQGQIHKVILSSVYIQPSFGLYKRLLLLTLEYLVHACRLTFSVKQVTPLVLQIGAVLVYIAKISAHTM